MPEPSISLPQINNDNDQKTMPPEGVSTQVNTTGTVNNDVALQENSSLKVQNGSAGTLISKKKVLALVALVVLITVSYLVYFIWLPNAQQDDYVKKLNEQYSNLRQNLALVSGEDKQTGGAGFVEISDGIFFDISQDLVSPYAIALEEANQNFDRVETFQTNVSSIKKSREEFRIGGGVKNLDNLLLEYLDNFENGLNKLHAFQSAKADIYNAIGEEYGREAEKLYGIYGSSVKREDKLAYVSKLGELSAASADRLRQLGAVPNDLRVFLDETIKTLDDQSATLLDMKKDYEGASEEGDKSALAKLSKFGERQLERSKKVQDESARVSRESEMVSDFKKAREAEGKLKGELDSQKSRLGVN